ncbi:retrotransposon protein, putative, ty1-copia subclass [Tanacetum coccineum]
MQLTLVAYLLPHLFTRWSNLRIVLSVEDKLNYLEHPIPVAPVSAQAGQQVAPEALAAHVAWVKGLKEISYIDNIERLGHPVSLGLGVSLILISLGKEFDGFVQNYNMHSMGKTINEFRAMLKLHEQTLPKNNAPVLHAIRAGKVQKGNNKHKKPQLQLAARGQNQGKGKNKLAYAPKPKIPPPPKRYDPAKDSVCHQCGDTGHWKRNRPQYLAELLKNKKLSQGASGSDNSIQVSSNNMVYFSAIPRDGIFEIDLFGSYTNVSSMYALSNKRAKSNLDTPLLWHCRLGHISKKRIEKLQHDGLLNSTDLRAFEKYVPCMSGKMARKPYIHQVERANTPMYVAHSRSCQDKEQATLSLSLTTLVVMDYALETVARILNMVSTKKVEKTPYKVWHGQAPKLSYLKFCGCEALVKRDTLTKPDKLEPGSIKCIFVGYPKETMGNSFYCPPENKLLVARNAEFLENSLITQEASGSLEDLEIIQEEDTHPSIDTSLNHEEDDLEIDEPQSDIILIHRSTRTRHAPDRMCLYIDTEEHKLGDLGKPANYKAALLDPESDKWRNAMNVEMQFLKDSEV